MLSGGTKGKINQGAANQADSRAETEQSGTLYRIKTTVSNTFGSLVSRLTHYRWTEAKGKHYGLLVVVFVSLWLGATILLNGVLSPVLGGSAGGSLNVVALVGAVGVTGYAWYSANSVINGRVHAAELSERPGYDDVQELLSLLESTDEITAAMAADGLVTVADNGAGKIMKNSQQTPEWVVSRGATMLHAERPATRSMGAALLRVFVRDYPDALYPYKDDLASLVEYPDSPVQIHIANILGQLGRNYPEDGEFFFHTLVGCLDDDDKDVRIAAIDGLVTLGNPELTDEVTGVLRDTRRDDTNPEVRERAGAALEAIEDALSE